MCNACNNLTLIPIYELVEELFLVWQRAASEHWGVCLHRHGDAYVATDLVHYLKKLMNILEGYYT